MSELIITAKLIKKTKGFWKLQYVKDDGGCVGGLYIPLDTDLPDKVVVKIVK